MYGDFSRMTYSRDKAYTGVWSQQGRVQLDSDANEQTAIVLNWLRTLAVDFIGPFGGHVTRAGFHVERDGEGGLSLSPGHYYIYGLRCDVAHLVRLPLEKAGEDEEQERKFLVQLLVWERSVSAVTDPDLLEPALGPYPPDTTVRSQVAWVPEVTDRLPLPPQHGTRLSDVGDDDLHPGYISHVFEEYNAEGRRHPLLAARAEPDVETEEATIVPATAGYLGVENQLYRVEVHRGGRVDADGDWADDARPTFKWSRDNGSVQIRITNVAESEKTSGSVATVTVASLGRDDSTGLDVGDWVELIDDTWRPQGEPRPLLRVQAIDRADLIVTLEGELDTDPSRKPYLRRWDQGDDDRAGPEGIPVTESPADGDHIWLELEDGVQVRFQANRAEYLRGDYWLIPARTATGGVLWPGGADAAVPPAGPARYLAPIALVHGDRVRDLRTLFTHLAWPENGDRERSDG
jgi:hypothetical protein